MSDGMYATASSSQEVWESILEGKQGPQDDSEDY